MENLLLPIFALLTFALVVTHGALPPEVYWKSVLPNTRIPKAVTDSLDQDLVNYRKGVNYGNGGVNYGSGGVNYGKGGVNYGNGGVNYGDGGVNYGKGGENYGEGGKDYGEGGKDYGKGGDDYGKGGEDYGKGGDYYGKGGEDYGKGGDYYGKGGEDYGKGGEDYGKGGEDYGKGGDDYGKGGEDYGKGGDDYGKGGEDYGKDYGKGGDDYGKGGEDYGKGGEYYGKGEEYYGKGGEDYEKGGEYYRKGGEYYEKGRKNYGKGGEYYGKGEEDYRKGGEYYRKGGEYYEKGGKYYGKGRENYEKGGEYYRKGGDYYRKGGDNIVLSEGVSFTYNATTTQLHDDTTVTRFFKENDLHYGTKMDLHFTPSFNKVTFLPRQVADSIPFSSNKVNDVFTKFSIKPESEEAKAVKNTLSECEETSIKGEEKYCATSLESMVDFSTSKLGKNLAVLSTEVDQDTGLQQYTVAPGVKKMSGDKAVVCHRQNYPYAVFYCHKTEATRTYFVSLKGANGIRVKVVAVCHTDTSQWNPKHLAFQALKVKPGTVPVCQFLPEDNVVWVQK